MDTQFPPYCTRVSRHFMLQWDGKKRSLELVEFDHRKRDRILQGRSACHSAVAGSNSSTDSKQVEGVERARVRKGVNAFRSVGQVGI